MKTFQCSHTKPLPVLADGANVKGRLLGACASLGLLVARDADDDLGVVEQEIVDPRVEALGVGVNPHGPDRLPELAFAVLGHGVDTVRRVGLIGFFRYDTVLSLMSPPQWESMR
jgi:hypothetical protein